MVALFRRAQGHVQHGAVFRDVDFVAPEHGVDPLPQAGFLRQLEEQLQGFVGDAVFRVIQVKARGLDGHPFAAFWVVREQFPQVQFANLLVMRGEGFPGRALGEWFEPVAILDAFHCSTARQAAFLSASLLDAITASNSFQDFTNDFAPSS